MKKIDYTYATIEQATVSTSDMFTQTILLSNTIDHSTETDEVHIVNKQDSTNAYNEMKKLFDSCEIELRQVQTDLQECMKENDELKKIGKVINLENEKNNLLVIELFKNQKKVLIPFVKEIVPLVDIKNNFLIINPPNGLLEL